ncbi:MAG: hypothetical protein O7G87_24170 [bacterium]|nr:hypothetical protein [bacterium]
MTTGESLPNDAVQESYVAQNGTKAGLEISEVGTESAYFRHNGKPLLSFGGMADVTFYLNQDAYDYKRWATWMAEHGMNHIRAYLPLSWKHVEKTTEINGGDVSKCLFPYKETEPGSRTFNLEQFDERFWKRFRDQLEFLEEKGTIVHLLVWNGWQLRGPDTSRDINGEINWLGHFFNPEMNCNTFTEHLGGDLENRYAIYHSVADGKSELVGAQKAFFQKVVEVTYDLDNVYFDLVHEIAEHRRDWVKTRQWIVEMAEYMRSHWAERTSKQFIIGFDTGGLSEEEQDWIYAHPVFNTIIYGKSHTVENAVKWRCHYQKVYIPQEGWDDNKVKYRLDEAKNHVHMRKYYWKFMLAKCQQLDFYTKGKKDGFGYFVNYDPEGVNAFTKTAPILRNFWNTLIDYGNLWFQGRVTAGPGEHQYILSSDREAIVYCSSATGVEGQQFDREELRVADLALEDGGHQVEVVDPSTGTMQTEDIVVQNGELVVQLPGFTDDIAVHVYRKA